MQTVSHSQSAHRTCLQPEGLFSSRAALQDSAAATTKGHIRSEQPRAALGDLPPGKAACSGASGSGISLRLTRAWQKPAQASSQAPCGASASVPPGFEVHSGK